MSIFLCHSSNDKPAVRQLYQRLSADGYDVWFDEEQILPGQDWNREIIHAVRNANIVIVCLSRSSITKIGYIQKEIKLILDAADERPDGVIFIIPVRLEDCTVPDRLSRYQWADLYKPDGYAKLLKSLHFAEAKKQEVSNIAFDTNTMVEAGILGNPTFEPSEETDEFFSRQLQQLTVLLHSTGDRERDKRRIKTLYGLLISFHGRDRFALHISENGQGHLIDFVHDTTRVCEELLARLRKLMGEESWRIEEIKF